jgi:hypothetical protein
MPHLYVNSKGKPWVKHSYSAGNDFDQSPYKYYLRRILGWREADNKARFAFGKALEESVQFHHEHNGQGAVQDFVSRWEPWKTASLSYTAVEKDWATCLQMGKDMIRLYVAIQPTLPIPIGGSAIFQREYMKEVFPNDPNYGGIKDAGKLDIVCFVDPAHPSLPKVEWKPEYGPVRPLIVDIKTSAIEFPEQPGMAAYDAQLRRYSWVSGIRDVSLLWFKKSGLGFKRGYDVTFIEPAGSYASGEQAVVAQVEGENLWVFKSEFMLAEMDRAHGRNEKGGVDQTKAGRERGQAFLQQHGLRVHSGFVTRQKIQFNAGLVTKASADDAGRVAARQIVSIVNAWKTGVWENTFGIRYPKDDRNDAYFRAFVQGDEDYRKKNFTKADEESFDDLFRDETEQ